LTTPKRGAYFNREGNDNRTGKGIAMGKTTRRVSVKMVKVYGWEGEGATAADAKAAAVRAIEAAAGGPSYAPRVITFKGHTAVITRDPVRGWEYFLIDDTGRPFGSAGPRPGVLDVVYGINDGRGVLGGYENLENAVRRARSHMAQNAFTPGTNPADVAGLILDEEDRREFLGWAVWQNACKNFRDARPDGCDDSEMRVYADDVRVAYLYPR
jgi:hypothetical protein